MRRKIEVEDNSNRCLTGWSTNKQLDEFFGYLLAITKNLDKKGYDHIKLRILDTVIGVENSLITAVHSNTSTKSNLYKADAGLETIKFLLFLCVSNGLITVHSYEVCCRYLNSICPQLQAWINSEQSKHK